MTVSEIPLSRLHIAWQREGAAVTPCPAVARRLGNTPTICRKCYIHPEVLTAFADGRLAKLNGAKPAVALRGLLRRRSMKSLLKASIRLAGKASSQRTPTH